MPWGLFGRNRRGLVVVHVVERDPRRSREANLLRVRADLLLRLLLKLLLGLPDIRDAQTTLAERTPVEQAARRGRAPPARPPSTSRPGRTARAFHRRTRDLPQRPSAPSFRRSSRHSHTLARATRQRAGRGRTTGPQQISALGTGRRRGPRRIPGPRSYVRRPLIVLGVCDDTGRRIPGALIGRSDCPLVDPVCDRQLQSLDSVGATQAVMAIAAKRSSGARPAEHSYVAEGLVRAVARRS
jgi:hypothetical protein